jgi:hypothetical protein
MSEQGFAKVILWVLWAPIVSLGLGIVGLGMAQEFFVLSSYETQHLWYETYQISGVKGVAWQARMSPSDKVSCAANSSSVQDSAAEASNCGIVFISGDAGNEYEAVRLIRERFAEFVAHNKLPALEIEKEEAKQ